MTALAAVLIEGAVFYVPADPAPAEQEEASDGD